MTVYGPEQYSRYSDEELASYLGLDEPVDRLTMISSLEGTGEAPEVQQFCEALRAAIDSGIDIPGSHAVTGMYRMALAETAALRAELDAAQNRAEAADNRAAELAEELDARSDASGDALNCLWKEVILAKAPDYGDWEYPGQAYRHLIAEFNALRAELDETRAELDALKAAQQGKPVSDPPQEYDDYLVWCPDYNGFEVKQYSIVTGEWHFGSNAAPTRWWPLPPAPDEVQP